MNLPTNQRATDVGNTLMVARGSEQGDKLEDWG